MTQTNFFKTGRWDDTNETNQFLLIVRFDEIERRHEYIISNLFPSISLIYALITFTFWALTLREIHELKKTLHKDLVFE